MSIVPYAMQMPGLMPAYAPRQRTYVRRAPRRTYRRRAPVGKICTRKRCYKRKQSILLKKSNWVQDIVSGQLAYRMLSGPKEERDVIRNQAKARVATARIERQMQKVAQLTQGG